MKPKASATERRIKSTEPKVARLDLQGQIRNCDRANALPAAAREHEHFYLLLFRNLIRQLALLLGFCTATPALARSGEPCGRIYSQGFSREQPGATVTFCGEIESEAQPHSCAQCNGLIRARAALNLSATNHRQNTGSAPERGPQENRRALSARDVLARQHGGGGTTLESTSNPVTTFNCYE